MKFIEVEGGGYVNLDYVTEISCNVKGDHIVKMTDGSTHRVYDSVNFQKVVNAHRVDYDIDC